MRTCAAASLAFALASSTLSAQNLIAFFAGTDWFIRKEVVRLSPHR
jgi:hypothetical protein